MSFFVGHALAALTIGKIFEEETTFTKKAVWQLCLVGCAFAPDLDYTFRSLNQINNGGLRVTHTIAFSLIIPGFLMFFLLLFRQENILWKGMQAALAGISHLILDLLVGSPQGDPLLYPLTKYAFILPFGILPSAGKVRLTNYFLYRNILLEIGILLPVFILILHFAHKLKIYKLTAFCLFSIFAVALVWSISLKR